MMDISFKTEAGKLNYRITAAIYNKKNKKFLLQKGNAFDFWVLPGGRCQMGELSQQAIKRELKEELGCLNIDKVTAVGVSENIFNFDTMYHELSFCYLVDITADSEIIKEQGYFYGPESKDYVFKWMTVAEIEEVDLKPEFLVDILKNIEKGDLLLKHHVLNEI